MGKYKVGDKVRVKSAEKLCDEFEVKKNDFIRKESFFTAAMWKYCGKKSVIVEEWEGHIEKMECYRIRIGNQLFVWNNYMFDDKTQIRYQKLRKVYEKEAASK